MFRGRNRENAVTFSGLHGSWGMAEDATWAEYTLAVACAGENIPFSIRFPGAKGSALEIRNFHCKGHQSTWHYKLLTFDHQGLDVYISDFANSRR